MKCRSVSPLLAAPWLLAGVSWLACDDTAGLDQGRVPLANIVFTVNGDVDALGLDEDMQIYANLIWQERASLDRVCLEDRNAPEAQAVVALGCTRRDFAPTHLAGTFRLTRAALDGRKLTVPLMEGPRDGATSAVLAVVISAERYGTPGLDLLRSGDLPRPSLPIDIVIAASTTPKDDRYSVIAFRDYYNRESDCAGFLGLLGAVQDSSGIDFGFSRIDIDKAGGVQRCDAVRLDDTPIRLELGRSPELTRARCIDNDEVIYYQSAPPDFEAPWYCITPRHFAAIDPDLSECPAIRHYATAGCYSDPYCDYPDYRVDTPSWWPCEADP